MKLEILSYDDSLAIRSALSDTIIFYTRDRGNFLGISSSNRQIYDSIINRNVAIKDKLMGNYRIVIEYLDENSD